MQAPRTAGALSGQPWAARDRGRERTRHIVVAQGRGNCLRRSLYPDAGRKRPRSLLAPARDDALPRHPGAAASHSPFCAAECPAMGETIAQRTATMADRARLSRCDKPDHRIRPRRFNTLPRQSTNRNVQDRHRRGTRSRSARVTLVPSRAPFIAWSPLTPSRPGGTTVAGFAQTNSALSWPRMRATAAGAPRAGRPRGHDRHDPGRRRVCRRPHRTLPRRRCPTT